MLNFKYCIVSSLLLISSLFFTACNGGVPIFNMMDKTLYESSTNFDEITMKLMKDLNPKIDAINDSNSSTLIVTDFVNINYFDNKSNLGFILSSSLKSSILNSFGKINIKEVALGKDIKVGANGIKLLTRDSNELKNKLLKDMQFILVGTYAITAKKLIVYLKLIDYTSGNIIASSSTDTFITKEIMMLEENKQDYNNKYITTPFVL